MTFVEPWSFFLFHSRSTPEGKKQRREVIALGQERKRKRDAAGAPTAAAAANANAAAAAAAANAAAMPATLGSGKTDDDLMTGMQEEFDAINAAAAAPFAEDRRRELDRRKSLRAGPSSAAGAGPSAAAGGSSAAAGAASVLVEYVATGNQTAQMTTEAIVSSVLAAPPPTPDEEIAQKAAELRAMLVKRKRDDFDIDDFDSCMKKAKVKVQLHRTLPDSSEFGWLEEIASSAEFDGDFELGAAARALRDLFLGATPAPSTDSPAELEKPQYRSAKTANDVIARATRARAGNRSSFGGDHAVVGEDRAAAEAPTRRRRGTAAGRRRTRRQRPRRSSHLRLLAQARIPEERAS